MIKLENIEKYFYALEGTMLHYNDIRSEMDWLIDRCRKLEGKIGTLFDVIKHGDDEHRAWLNAKIQEHFNE